MIRRHAGLLYQASAELSIIDYQSSIIIMNDSDKTREQLIEEIKLFRTLLDTLPDRIFVKDAQGRFIICNKAVEETVEIHPSDGVIGKSDFDLYPPEKAKQYYAREQEIIKTGVPMVNEEVCGLHPETGGPSWSLSTKLPWRDKDGNIIGIIGANREITERKNIEQALLESENRYKTIFETTREGILIVDDETKLFKYANPAVCVMFGYTTAEMTRLKVEDIHPKEQMDWILADFEANIGGKKNASQNIPCLHRNGSIFYADINTAKVIIDNRRCNIVCFTDVTRHKLDDEALRQSEQRFKSVVENIPVSVVLLSPQMEIISINNRLRRVYPDVDILSRPICYKTFNSPPRETPCLYCPVVKTLADGQIHETIIDTPRQGKIVHVRIIASPVKDTEGRITGIIEVVEDITERRHAEDALRESEQKFRLLVEQLPAITYTAALDEASTTLYVSPQVKQILGVSPDDYKADPDLWRKILHPDDVSQVMKAVERTHKTGLPLSSEYRMIAQDGHIVWIRDEASIVKDAEGKCLYLQGVMYDITAAKQAEVALRESEEKFRGLAERSFDMIFVTDEKGYFTYLSPASERIFGYKPEEMTGRHFSNFLLESEIPKAVQKFTDRLDGKDQGTQSFEAVKKNGSSVFIEVNASSFLLDGNPVGTQGIIHDVTDRIKVQKELQKSQEQLEVRVQQRTADLAGAVEKLQKEIAERKRAEDSLRQAEERFRTIFVNAIVGIYRTAPDGQILMANPAIVKMMGYNSFDELSRLNLEKDGFDPSTPRSAFKQLIERDGFVSGLESIWLRCDGSRLYVLENAFAVRDTKGNILYYEGTAQDITKRKEAEEKLMLYQEQLRSLAAQLSLAEERLRRKIATDIHDNVSQNLAISKMKLEALAQSVNSDQAESLKEISDLIGQTIEVSRSLTFEMSPPILYELGFVPALDWLVNRTRQRFAIETEFVDDGKPKPLVIDVSVLLFQAVRELVNNVIKHAKARNLKITASSVRSSICITVEDDGLGFEMAHAMSARKHSSKKDVSDYSLRGFGLFNIRERLDHIGGSIEIHSKSGQGTRVTLFVPLLKTPKNRPKKNKMK
jgi:PAS domain S-box-containing protein